MAGQIIKLPGVTAAAVAGAPRILMGAADTAALRIASLAHAVSAKALTSSADGVAGRCRVTGKLLTAKGAAAANLQLRTGAGFTGIGYSGTSGNAGLALPAGSAFASYTLVLALCVIETVATASSNPISAFNVSDALTVSALRHYGSASTNTALQDGLYAGGGGIVPGTPSASTPTVKKPAGSWVVVAIDFNDNTLAASISANGGAFNTTATTTHNTSGAGGYLEIGNHSSSSGMSNTLLGDLYVFSDSLLKTALGQTQLAAVIAGLKSDYGIA